LTTNEIFDLQDRIMLYDLNNNYFKGNKRQSRLAKYGPSKEKRSDAKLVVLAMVINIEGFIKYPAFHEGSYADTSDIKTLLEKVSFNTSVISKPIVVMDAGIATEKNLATLTQQGYKYVVLSRSKLKNYQPVHQGKETYLLTKSSQRNQRSRHQKQIGAGLLRTIKFNKTKPRQTKRY
jgi:transposase